MENIEEYLQVQKQKLEFDKSRLSFDKKDNSSEIIKNSVICSNNNGSFKSTEKDIDSEYFNKIHSEKNTLNSNENDKTISIEITSHSDDPNNFAKQGELPHVLSSCIFNRNDPNSNSRNNSSRNNSSKEQEGMYKSPFEVYDEIMKRDTVAAGCESFRENNKINYNFVSKNKKEIGNVNKQNNWTRRNQNDDMEQWISDTFYSYFPSLNAEQTKRENNNRARQLEYQNYLKKTSNVQPTKYQNVDEQNTKPTALRGDKTEMEIIVTTNPNYESHSKYRDNYSSAPLRPLSTRAKLLQDLKHTELSNMMYDDAVQQRNQEDLEREMMKKKEYQKDLMRQIEEKRREIELLKQKEKMEEEHLTRKLEEQLKTMELQEELEKEKIRTERTRFEVEKNKIIREQLLAKLENDKKLQLVSPISTSRETKSENDKDSLLDQSPTNKDQNKNEVYRFFTNSARREFRKPYHNQSLTEAFEEFSTTDIAKSDAFVLESQTVPRRRRSSPISLAECSHLNRNVCPFCEIKLKNYESWCPQCKKPIFDDGAENRTMLCENCESQYLICSACDKNKNTCEFCNRKRNICTHCIRKFCIHCGNSIHIHKPKKSKESNEFKYPETPSEHSFEIIEFPNEDNNSSLNNFRKSDLENNNSKSRFSTNYDRNSIFHPKNRIFEPKYQLNIKNGEIFVNNKKFSEDDFDEKKINDKLANYVKNYGDLVVGKKSKRFVESNINKEVSLNEMPLLSEIPKKKSNLKKVQTDNGIFKADSDNNFNNMNNMVDLSRRWEVPAVEKRTISTSSPIVLTQLGAVRRQLQMDRLQLDNII